MNLKDLHTQEDIPKMLHHMHHVGLDDLSKPFTTRHLGKNNKRIDADVSRSDITYKGKKAQLIIATDITQKVKQTEALQLQNEKLKEIAFLQSHVVRLPLARIMSITELIIQDYDKPIDREVLNYLNNSAQELDLVIRQIIEQSTDMLSGLNDE